MHYSKQIIQLLTEIAIYVRNGQQKQIADTGLQIAQINMLRIVYLHGPMTQTEIAGYLLISSATVTVTIKNLVKLGYLEKNQNQQDLRYNTINLTPKGELLALQAISIMDSFEKKLFMGFDNEEMAGIASWLEQFRDNLDNILNDESK